ncbi:MAG: SMI1/KNR4 family protein, partial [bacterium]|nr:SMI1/KNR4 family protein [bacterium]
MNAPSPFIAIPAQRAERWEILRAAVGQWYEPLGPEHGVSQAELDEAEARLGAPLPRALREWYALAGARDDIWSRQDHLLLPRAVQISDGYLVFLIENQSVVDWGIREAACGLEDPPVFVSSADDSGQWIQENPSVSEFALQFLASCVKWSSSRWWATGWVGREVVAAIKSEYPRLSFPTWHWPGEADYFGYRDIIAETVTDAPGAWLTVTTRTAVAAAELQQLLRPHDVEWNAWSE